jgi:hypothetical protein
VNPPVSRNFSPAYRDGYQTCPVDQTCPARGQLPESPTGLVWWTGLVWSVISFQKLQTGFQRLLTKLVQLSPASRKLHQTSLVRASPNDTFEVGAINRPPPTPRAIGHSEKVKNTRLRSKSFGSAKILFTGLIR